MRNSVSTGKFGPISVVSFGQVDVDPSSVFNKSTNTVIIPQAGLYYLHIEVGSCSTGWAQLNLNLNGAVVLNTYFNQKSNVVRLSRNQAVILALEVGDELIAFVPSSSACICCGPVFNSFHGFLLGPQ